MTLLNSETDPQAVYRARAARFAAEREAYTARWNRVANGRLLLFLAAAALAGLALWRGPGWLYWPAGLLVLLFVAAVVYHTWLGQRRRRLHELWAINDEGLLRARRAWATLPLRTPPGTEPAAPPLAADLDLLGRASLQHLLSTPATPVGQRTLRRWLLEPAEVATIVDRQVAVAALAPLLDFRDHVALVGRLAKSPPDDERLVGWAEGSGWLSARPWLVWLARLVALVALVLFVAVLLGQLPFSVLLALIAVNGLITLVLMRPVEGAIGQVEAGQEGLQAYATLFDLITGQPLQAPLLQRIQADLSAGGAPAGQRMRRLALIMALAELRRSALVGLPLQLLTLWNVHVLWLLEGWQHAAGKQARAWLAATGQVEALNALATLHHDQPTWAFPTLLESDQPIVEARAMGHPLLTDSARVANDLTLGPPGSFLLITGSNMSGKSTLLRSLGLNVVLAQAGGPVCAAAMRLPPLELATSMRVQDSLEQGVSFFMAELRRLKLVVEAAERAKQQGNRTLLYLLDEILQGTNTVERQIAARRIIRHLLSLGALGAVSTHDLALADAPDLQRARQAVYLTEILERGADGPQMRFDYQLRPGIATSSNALALMELVGLPLEDEQVLKAEG